MAITLDATSTAGTQATSPLQWNHVVGAGNNRYLIVTLANNAATQPTVTAVTFNGVSMTKLNSKQGSGGVGNNEVSIWGLANPPVGTFQISATATLGTTPDFAGNAISYFGVDPNEPDAISSTTNTSAAQGAQSWNHTVSRDQSWIVAVGNYIANGATQSTLVAGQTNRGTAQPMSIGLDGEMATEDTNGGKTGGSTTSMSFTTGGSTGETAAVFTAAAVSLGPAVASGTPLARVKSKFTGPGALRLRFRQPYTPQKHDYQTGINWFPTNNGALLDDATANAQLLDIWNAGIRKLRVGLPAYDAPGAILDVRHGVGLAVAQGFYVVYGLAGGATLTSTTWTSYSTTAQAEATWAQSNGVGEFVLGNELEYTVDGTTLTTTGLRANLRSLATTCKSLFTNGPISYNTSRDWHTQWISEGLGDIKFFGLNAYIGGSDQANIPNDTGYQTDSALVYAAFGQNMYMSEWSLDYISLIDFSGDESVQRIYIQRMLTWFNGSGIPAAYYFNYYDDSTYLGPPTNALFGVRKTSGEYRLWAPLLGFTLNPKPAISAAPPRVSNRRTGPMALRLRFRPPYSPQAATSTGPNNFVQNLTAQLSFAGNTTKAISETKTGQLSFVGALKNAISETKTGQLSFAGALKNAISSHQAGQLSFSGALKKAIFETKTGQLSFIGTLGKAISTHLAGQLSFSGAITKALTKAALTAQLSFSGVLTISHVAIKALAAQLSFIGNLTKSTSSHQTGQLSFSGALKKAISETKTASLSFSGAVVRFLTKSPLTGSLSFSGAIAKRTAPATKSAQLSFSVSNPLAIAPDATTTSIHTGSVTSPTYSWTHTITGNNPVLIITVGYTYNSGSPSVTALTYNGVSLTLVSRQAHINNGATETVAVEQWYMAAPPTGANTVSITITGAIFSPKIGASSFVNVKQTSPLDTNNPQFQTGAHGTYTASITTGAGNELVLASFAHEFMANTATSNQTSLFDDSTGGDDVVAASYQIAGVVGSYSDVYTIANTDANIQAEVSVMGAYQPAPATGGFTKSTSHHEAAQLSFSGALKRAISVLRSAQLSFSGFLSTIKSGGGPQHFTQVLAATLSFSASLSKKTAKTVPAAALSFLTQLITSLPPKWTYIKTIISSTVKPFTDSSAGKNSTLSSTNKGDNVSSSSKNNSVQSSSPDTTATSSEKDTTI